MSLIQSSGQYSLLEEDVDNQIVSDTEIFEEFENHLNTYRNYTKINICMAEFYISHGITLSSSRLKARIKLLETNHSIDVSRKSELTPSGKKKSTTLSKETRIRKARNK